MTPSDSLGPKIGGWVQTAHNYLLRGLSYDPFCPKFRCHGNGGQSGVNTNETIKLANFENHIIEPKITTLSYT